MVLQKQSLFPLLLFPLFICLLRAQQNGGPDGIIGNGAAIPIILAVDPPAGNETQLDERSDLAAILNGTTNPIAADVSKANSSAEVPETAQMDLANGTMVTQVVEENRVPGPERGENGTAKVMEEVAMDANGGESTATTTTSTDSGGTSTSTPCSSSTNPPAMELVKTGISGGAQQPPDAAADAAAAPINGPPSKVSLQAINVPNQSNSAEENTTQSRNIPNTNFAQSPQFAPQQTCTSDDCNDRGTCIGIRGLPLCLCNAGFTGSRCQEEACDPTRDCNGRGWCAGTQEQYTCFCNFGYTGSQCQNDNFVLGRRR